MPRTRRECREYILSDLERIIERKATLIDACRFYLFPRGTTFPYIFWFRVVQYQKTKGRIRALIPYLILRHFEYKYGVHMNTNIEVGKGLLIVHGGGVYLNCKSIGNNFTVYQGVTLGTKKFGIEFSEYIPQVDNNVTIYTGAVVCGLIEIKDGVTIGANVYVDKDVEKGSVVVGNPARKI